MKVRALPRFEGIKDLERNVFPKAGDEWEVTEERAKVLIDYGVAEIVTEEKVEYLSEPEEVVLEPITNIHAIAEEDMTPEQKESYEKLKKEKLTEKALEKRIIEEPKKKKSNKK